MDDKNSPRVSPPARPLILLACITLLFLVLSVTSSGLPDGLEASAEKVGLVGSDPVGGISLPDHLPSEWLAALIGVVLCGLVLWGLCTRILVRRSGVTGY